MPDELESKLEILWLLDRMAPPRTVFATPTTRLSIADLAACTYRDDKCVAIAAEARDLTGNSGAEILLRTTARTTPETIALLENFWRRLGFAPTFQQEAAVWSVISGQFSAATLKKLKLSKASDFLRPYNYTFPRPISKQKLINR